MCFLQTLVLNTWNQSTDIPVIFILKLTGHENRCNHRKKKWKSMSCNKVFIIHYSLHKSVEKMLMANFCHHQASLQRQIQQ